MLSASPSESRQSTFWGAELRRDTVLRPVKHARGPGVVGIASYSDGPVQRPRHHGLCEAGSEAGITKLLQ